ncbi:MAG TPA: alpha-2-macroglobulin family protein, partial [Prolixibacteraceae bacterium]|nr:alpha-2-macroglobulin family protein [Prolixibacteraceae bacterium]
RLKPVADWKVKLPTDGDFQTHRAEIRIPSLPAGQYVLLATAIPGFRDCEKVTWMQFQCTGLSLISALNAEQTEFLVLDRKEGQPIDGVKVRKYYFQYDYSKRKEVTWPGETGITDKYGMVKFDSSATIRQGSCYLVLRKDMDQFFSQNFYLWQREKEEPRPEMTTWFFTDRAIYRPGQTIFFKGIVTEKNGTQVSIKTRFKTVVRFRDVNDQELSKMELITNEFGSFSGSFTAPAGGLTGSFSIGDEHGTVEVQVEEYKRPKFEITFNPVKGTYKLGEAVTVTGKAMAYSGNPVTDATVSFRVMRNARFPWFRRWFFDPPFVPAMEITQGQTTTNAEGEFSIRFEAIPDPSIPKDNLPLFDFSLEADISDINGETHNAQTNVAVGYKSLLINTGLADEVNGAKDLKFTLETTNLNGQPEAASGALTIYRVKIPENFLFPRKWSKPDLFTMTRSEFKKSFPNEIYDNEDDISTWEKGEKILDLSFATPSDSLIGIPDHTSPGLYVLEITTKDSYGEEVVYKKYFTLYLPGSTKNPSYNSLMTTLVKNQAEPGENVPLLLASPLRNVYLVADYTSVAGKPVRTSYRLDNNQLSVDIPVSEEHRGNMGIYFFFVKNNRLFQEQQTLRVPYTNKKLDITLTSFRDKLRPGEQEEWSLTIRDKKGDKALAEMMASMYDASLDAFLIRPWNFSLYTGSPAYVSWNADRGFGTASLTLPSIPGYTGSPVPKNYEQLMDISSGGYYGNKRLMIRGLSQPLPPPMANDVQMEVREEAVFANVDTKVASASGKVVEMKTAGQEAAPSLPPAKPRSDFRETAFFFPQLATNASGETVLKFKMPESLTRWKFTGLAHTKDLKTGMIEKSLVTQKELMVFPNAPRFLREGDRMQFTVKISNLSGAAITGTSELHFFDAFTMKPVDDLMGNTMAIKDFQAGAGESAVAAWDITVPESLQAVIYRVTATSGSFSDGEEAALPVLSNRMMVTESLPLPVRANSTKSFTFKKLADSGKSKTLRNYRLTLEYTSNPAWYAVQALPYLMEFPYECSEQLFSRYYANTLVSSIANSDPAIKRVFESWKQIAPSALKSNLEKNEELKSVLIQESPWVREAAGETERKQRIGILFDLTRMAMEQEVALKKLADNQTVNGGWPWFPGMPESEYITRHIVAGLGHLIHLKSVDPEHNPKMGEMVQKAVAFLDQEMLNDFQELKKRDTLFRKNNHLDASVVQYFYARSFFRDAYPFDDSLLEMVAFYQAQAVQHWTGLNNYLKAMTALFLNRMEDGKTARLILKSLGETALRNEELGMYWRNQTSGWFWHQAPIETQSMLIEAFDEVAGDLKSVDELKVWLLKQKQTQDWKTTRATTEAVYALLLRGTSGLASNEQVKVTLGKEQVNPYLSTQVKPEPGTGYFKTSWDAAGISSDKGKVKVENPNATIAWGSLYWQYFEQLDKITKADSPLNVEKNLFVEVKSPTGLVLKAITADRPIRVGDKVVVRVILRTDRDMEYVHLKDMRASAFEPLNVLSGYRWQAGLGYYESTRDAATNFFIDYLPKGNYVFEYRLFATQKGEFSNGITSVQCMYAPEFAAHTEGIRIKVE